MHTARIHDRHAGVRALRRQGGFSLVELMVALTLGLLLLIVMLTAYVYSKNSVRRQEQLNGLQQNVRIAFEYLSSDARMVGHLGCQTGRSSGFANNLSATALPTNFALGVEGYNYNTGAAFTIASLTPANVTEGWTNNTTGITAIPATTISDTGMTPGSDVLVIRTVAGEPVRLGAITTSGATSLTVENAGSTGVCASGSANVSGFCPGSFGLIAGCSAARVFQLGADNIATGPVTLTLLSPGLGTDPVYSTAGSEVFPMQTIVYYVKQVAGSTGPSLHRRIFDGNTAAGIEQELVEGVETIQVRYGVDTTGDKAVDSYVDANSVADWNSVVAIRMSVLIRAPDRVEGDVEVASTGSLGGVTFTYPSTTRYDRRVFTTTVAIRNKISSGL